MVRKRFDSSLFLSKVGKGRTILPCHKGQVVFRQGDAAEAVFFLQQGRMKLTVVSERGKEAVVAVLNPDSFFGEGCLNGQALRLFTASALTEATVLRIAKKEMLRVLQAEPTFAARFMSYLLERNTRVEEDLVDQLFNSSEKRLARVLLYLPTSGKIASPNPSFRRSVRRCWRRWWGRPLSRELLHEQVSETWIHRVQRHARNSQFAPQRRPPRLSRFPYASRANPVPPRLRRGNGISSAGQY